MILVTNDEQLRFAGKSYKCAFGRWGILENKKEGDGVTPMGCFVLREVFYRPDKFAGPPETALPLRPLMESDGWSDDVNRPEYNKLVGLPYIGSHEKLWREDDIYDLIVVLGYNDSPPILGKGSAIFMHIARENYTPTDGCVALAKGDLLEILASVKKETKICIGIPK